MKFDDFVPTKTKQGWLASICLIMFCSAAYPQNQFNLSDLETGQLILNLDASEMVTVEQDTLTISLEYSVQGRDKNALQNEVNVAMSQGVDLLKQTEDVDYITLQYRVYIVRANSSSTNADIQNPLWQAQQGIRLTSKNTEELLDYAGELQGLDLHVTSMNYSLSSEVYEATADSLMTAALTKLQSRADEAARALNKGSADLVEINLNSNSNNIYRAGVSMDSRVQLTTETPVAIPGETEVRLNVSARALLSP